MAEVDKVQSRSDQSQTAPAIINSSSEGTYFLLSSFFMWAHTRSDSLGCCAHKEREGKEKHA